MRTSLGISAGNEVVCSALVTTAANGARKFDYRVVSSDSHSDLGDIVASSIELMTTQLPSVHPQEAVFGPNVPTTRASGLDVVADRPPAGVAVAYRGREQEQAIRMATGKHRDTQLVDETTAALTFLRDTGLVDRYGTVAVIDLGASGCTVSVADPADGALLHSARSTAVSGRVLDDLIYRHLVDQHYARRGARPNRSLLHRARTAKEHLSVTQAVTIDHIAGRPLKLTRPDFDLLAAPLLEELVRFATMTFGLADREPEAIVVIGGGANVPAVLETLRTQLDRPVLTVPDPDAVIAKGAAMLADTAHGAAPAGARTPDRSGNTLLKAFGTVAGAIVVVGLIVGYGMSGESPPLAPSSDSEHSPTGTTADATHVPATTPAAEPAPTTTEEPVPPQPVEQPADDHVPYTPPYEPPVTVVPTTPSEPTTEDNPSTSENPSTTGESSEPSATTPPPVDPDDPAAPRPSEPILRPNPDLPPIPFPEGLAPDALTPPEFGPETTPEESPPPAADDPSAEDGPRSTETTLETTPPPRPRMPGSGSAG